MENMSKEDLIKKALYVQGRFGYLSGRWAENEYIHEEIADEEMAFITQECSNLGFQYEIDLDVAHGVAEEYDEEPITQCDVLDYNLSEENYWQFDAIAFDIKEQLINHLINQI